jgi:hypothetical protein
MNTNSLANNGILCWERILTDDDTLSIAVFFNSMKMSSCNVERFFSMMKWSMGDRRLAMGDSIAAQ